ncbi:PREDICTED: transmembrane protein 40 [Thamnophis sirtalis]|uniref:Transmembrane protein 40 n=1 Tax=Thamnophis sirtalis TaxID=35019 RepID=A0A6I9X9Y4_9SAUR|nr:PREDICTED: transmembrane protein 40 [Thamnophis sirtalis]
MSKELSPLDKSRIFNVKGHCPYPMLDGKQIVVSFNALIELKGLGGGWVAKPYILIQISFLTVCDNGVCHSRWWVPRIQKDDEFFHFVIICFAVGMLLVCYYKYNNWTISTGIGLMTFAVLETTGIYFGLWQRIRSILEAFIPLVQRIRMPGFKKLN